MVFMHAKPSELVMCLEELKRQVHPISEEVFSIISYVFCCNRGFNLILLMLFLVHFKFGFLC
jgi:hypothetical protein